MLTELMEHTTKTETVMEFTRGKLRELDPEFLDEETSFVSGVLALRDTLAEDHPVDLDAVLEAEERRLAGNLVFLIWKGLVQNLACFKDPVAIRFLDLDYEDLHQEEVMNNMQASISANQLYVSFVQTLTPEQKELSFAITSYYSYWETVAYKLAHFWGFSLGDQFLPKVVPGYYPNHAATSTYALLLSNCLGFPVLSIGS